MLFLLLTACPGPQTPSSTTTAGPLGRTPPALDLLGQGDAVFHLYGSEPVRGSFGVAVAGGGDVDGDGHADVVLGTMRASPNEREAAGIVYLSFGDGTTVGARDSFDHPRVLRIFGAGPLENAGSELWMDDITGDGLADVLIARQNAEIGGVVGAGAVSVVIGSPALAARAEQGLPLDLADPDLDVLTIGGVEVFGRLGIWLRTGDVTGDGVADLLIGADQERFHGGTAWLVQGGPWIADGAVTTVAPGPLDEHILRIVGPEAPDAHFGGTVALGDLDGNGKAELFIASTLNRAGASLVPDGDGGETHGFGGFPHGQVTIVWDAAIPAAPWPRAAELLVESAAPITRITGGNLNNHFGEELVGGFDWDGDGAADLFVGDLASDLSPGGERPTSGVGVVLYGLAAHAGQDIHLATPPDWLEMTVLLGAALGDLFADTAGGGDVDGDGNDDLVITSPDADPGGRDGAGIAAVLFGGQRWPRTVDLSHDRLPQPDRVRIVEVWGALGTRNNRDFGDMLAYSAAVADIDADGKVDLVSNEMLGNGLQPNTDDVGNLVVIGGATMSAAEQ